MARFACQIFILPPPSEDPNVFELASECLTPVQTVCVFFIISNCPRARPNAALYLSPRYSQLPMLSSSLNFHSFSKFTITCPHSQFLIFIIISSFWILHPWILGPHHPDQLTYESLDLPDFHQSSSLYTNALRLCLNRINIQCYLFHLLFCN